MAIHIRVARAPRELEAVYAVRARARQELSGGKEGAGPQLVDRFDTFGSTTNLLITDGATPVGTMRLAEATDVGLPGDRFHDFGSIRPFLSGSIIGIDGLFLLRQYRSRPGILMAAMKVAVQVVRARQGRHLLILAPRELAPFLEEVGLSAIGQADWCDASQAWLVPLYGLLSGLRLPVIEWRNDSVVEALGEALHRSIYVADEEICREGEPGDCAYVVARGSVSVTASRPDGSEVLLNMLGPGEVFGEVALLDPGNRTATVRAYAQETDLIVLERAVFRSLVFGDPVRTEAMLRLLARKLRACSAQIASLAPQDVRPYLLRLLRDVGRSHGTEGEVWLAGVTLEWLAGQIGRLPVIVEEMIGGLEQEGLVRWDDGLWIRDYKRLDRLVNEHEQEARGEWARSPLSAAQCEETLERPPGWRSALEYLS